MHWHSDIDIYVSQKIKAEMKYNYSIDRLAKIAFLPYHVQLFNQKTTKSIYVLTV